jgi:signal transduction histidine kinase
MQIEKSKDKFIFFLNNLEEYVFEVDRNGKVIFVSKHFEKSKINITGTYLHAHLPANFQLKFFKALDTASTSLSPSNFNFTKKNLHYNMSLIPILDSDHILCVIRNVTELFKLQSNALKDEAKLLDVANLNKIAFWEYDLINKEFHSSKELDSIFEIPSGTKFDANGWKEFTSKETASEYILKFEECIKNGQFEMTNEIKTLNENSKFIKVVGRAILDSDGSPITIIGSVLDITQQKLEVENRCELDKMASIGRLAGRIGHEINNPLAIISGFSQKLKRLAKEDDVPSELVNKYAQKIEDTTYRIKKIVDSLSKVSRSTKNEQDLQEVTIASIIEDTLSICQEKFKSEGIEISTNHLTVNTLLKVNPIEISQIFLNLLTNAFDAIIELENRWVNIYVEDVGSNVLISVIDSGNGISEDHKKKILEPFFTTKPLGKGTGLGLSISRSILDKYSGTIKIKENSSNTCFEISLPKYIKNKDKFLLAGGYIPSKEPAPLSSGH